MLTLNLEVDIFVLQTEFYKEWRNFDQLCHFSNNRITYYLKVCLIQFNASGNVYLFIDLSHDNVIKWKPFPRYWPFVWGIHRSPVNSPHKGQWRGALVFALICAWINDWVNNRDLRRYRAHYDVIVMRCRKQLKCFSIYRIVICRHYRYGRSHNQMFLACNYKMCAFVFLTSTGAWTKTLQMIIWCRFSWPKTYEF